VSLSRSDWLGPHIGWCYFLVQITKQLRRSTQIHTTTKSTFCRSPRHIRSTRHDSILSRKTMDPTALPAIYLILHLPTALETLRTFCSCHSFRSIPTPTLFIPLNFALSESLYLPFCRRSCRKGPQTLLRLSRTSILGRYES